MSTPGFTAEAALEPPARRYRSVYAFAVMPATSLAYHAFGMEGMAGLGVMEDLDGNGDVVEATVMDSGEAFGATDGAIGAETGSDDAEFYDLDATDVDVQDGSG